MNLKQVFGLSNGIKLGRSGMFDGGLVYGPPISIYINPSTDTYLNSSTPSTNYVGQGIYAGEYKSGTFITRGLIKFPDWTWFPANGIISAASLKLYLSANFSSNARTLRLYKMLHTWTDSQVTWNRYATGQNWPGGAGAFGAVDCEQIAVASRDFAAAEATGEYKEFVMTGVTKVADIDNGYGQMLKADTEVDDEYGFSPTAGAGNKPQLHLTYTVPLSEMQQFSGVGDSKSLAASNTWPQLLNNYINFTGGDNWARLGFAAKSGGTCATIQDEIDTLLAAITVGSANAVFVNIGANDALGTLPAEATWKADYLYILDAVKAKFPNATCYLTRPWCRGQAADCNTLATWIGDIPALRSFCQLGDDERVWLENGDDGATMTSDGVHYTSAGQTAKAAQARALLGY